MKLYIYSNRHIKDQVINIEKNGCIVLENDLSKFIWKKYFQYNKLDEIESTINYVKLDKFLSKEFKMEFDAIVGKNLAGQMQKAIADAESMGFSNTVKFLQGLEGDLPSDLGIVNLVYGAILKKLPKNLKKV